MMQEERQLNVRLPEELYAELKRVADVHGFVMARIVIDGIERRLGELKELHEKTV